MTDQLRSIGWALFGIGVATIVVGVVFIFEREAWRAVLDQGRPVPVRVFMGAWATLVLGLCCQLAAKLKGRR